MTEALVNGVVTAPDAHGKIQGSFATASTIAGTDGNDILQGNHGNDIFYGGAGNDTFQITAASLANATDTTNGYAANDVIYDFGGAGVKGGDFLSLTGFGAGSTLSFDRYGDTAGVVDNTRQYYTVTDGVSHNTYTIYIHSLDGNQLTVAGGDFHFY